MCFASAEPDGPTTPSYTPDQAFKAVEFDNKPDPKAAPMAPEAGPATLTMDGPSPAASTVRVKENY